MVNELLSKAVQSGVLMKKFSLAALAATAMIALAAPAAAADFSFVGTLANDDEVLLFNFNVGSTSLVTLRTYSYAGGTNAAGDTIARGGFDPILSLYNSAGERIGQNDDGGFPLVPFDSVSGNPWDTYFQSSLAAGAYTVAVTQFENFAPNHLSDPFPGSGQSFFGGRDAHWAFDVLNVGDASQAGAVPEPATWAMMIIGMGGIGGMIRRRRTMQAATA
jgi:hypothetical protein